MVVAAAAAAAAVTAVFVLLGFYLELHSPLSNAHTQSAETPAVILAEITPFVTPRNTVVDTAKHNECSDSFWLDDIFTRRWHHPLRLTMGLISHEHRYHDKLRGRSLAFGADCTFQLLRW